MSLEGLSSVKICRLGEGRKVRKGRWRPETRAEREAVLNEKACKSIGTEKHMPGAWLTPKPANEEPEHLPKGSHKIILDIPMVLPQFPQNSQHRITNIFTAAAGRPQTMETSGEMQLK